MVMCSNNALILGLEELGCGVLCLCATRVHHVREGIMFPPALSKCIKKIRAKSKLWITT